MNLEIRLAADTEALERCFAVMHELRPHVDREQFLAQVRRQVDTQHYCMAYLKDDGEVRAVAGFRFIEMLAWGRAMYVDDLVTTSTCQGRGYGSRLFEWLVKHARERGCAQLHLDSGVQRHDAHRFYLRKRMDITSFHFAMNLELSPTISATGANG